MQCPKCNKDNQKGAKVCEFCSCALAGEDQPKNKAKRKVSWWAIAGIIIFFFSPSAFVSLVLTPICGIISYVLIKKSNVQIWGKRLALCEIIIPAILLPVMFLWSMDADEIPNDYTIDDLRSAPAQYNESYEILMSLADGPNDPNYSAIGLSQKYARTLEKLDIGGSNHEEIINVVTSHAEEINFIWGKAKKGRDVVSRLDSFAEIADLAMPNFPEEDGNYHFSHNIHCLEGLYNLYICLNFLNGNEDIAIKELIALDGVLRKLSVNARERLTKMVCLFGLRRNIDIANFFANRPETSQRSIEIIAEHFEPLIEAQTSVRNEHIYEYLIFKEAVRASSEEDANSTKPGVLKKNSSFRVMKNYYDKLLIASGKYNSEENEELSVWPRILNKLPNPELKHDGRLPRIYEFFNPIGSLLVYVFKGSDILHDRRTRLQVNDDLLQIVMNRRLGREVSLKARAYSDEYIVDLANKKILSPGPDGKVDTKDDIYLEINPEVLGWDETVN